MPGIWVGYIPSLARYREVDAAAKAKGIRLVKCPAQHHRAIESDRAVELLGDPTPDTVFAQTQAQTEAAGQRLGCPVFVNSKVKSRSADGRAACVAANQQVLRAMESPVSTAGHRRAGWLELMR